MDGDGEQEQGEVEEKGSHLGYLVLDRCFGAGKLSKDSRNPLSAIKYPDSKPPLS